MVSISERVEDTKLICYHKVYICLLDTCMNTPNTDSTPLTTDEQLEAMTFELIAKAVEKITAESDATPNQK